jgi:NADPH:quinone reductase-like Zn-dependent oxidoreductase
MMPPQIPDNIDPTTFVTVPASLATAFHTLSHDLKLRIIPFEDPSVSTGPLTEEEASKRILIWGASSSAGSYFVQVLAQSGYKHIIAVASAGHHAWLKEVGATQTVDYRNESWAQDIGEKVDLVADCIGDREETISKIAQVVKNDKQSIVAILLPIRYGGRAATQVGFELDEGALPDQVQISLVRTHAYENVRVLSSIRNEAIRAAHIL